MTGGALGPIDTHAHLDRLPRPRGGPGPGPPGRPVRGGGRGHGPGLEPKNARTGPGLARLGPAGGRPATPGRSARRTGKKTWTSSRRHLPRAAALGEVGLDYKVKVKKSLQVRALADMLEAAAGLDKPVMFHSRFSQRRSLDMLVQAGVRRAVFHWYSGPLDLLDRILEAGYYVSATPALAYSPPHRAALARAPLDRILVETDAPVEYQGQASEPAHVLRTIRLLAGLRGLETDQAAALTTRNALDFLGRRPPLNLR